VDIKTHSFLSGCKNVTVVSCILAQLRQRTHKEIMKVSLYSCQYVQKSCLFQQRASTAVRKENTPEEQSINWKEVTDGSDEKILSLVGNDLLVLTELCGLFLFMWVCFLCTSCIKIDHT